MKITMNETRRICDDGFTPRRLEKGQTYDLGDTMARAAIRQGWAIEAPEGMDAVNRQFDSVFGQSARPTNPATLKTMGADV